MKKIVLQFTACLLLLSNRLTAQEIDAVNFKKWWLNFRSNSAIPAELKQMEDYFISSELLNQSSKFWLYLNKMNIEQIVSFGYENFKQTVACNYFTWVVDNYHSYSKNLFQEDLSFLDTLPLSELKKKHDLFSQEQSIQYNRTTAMFYDFLIKRGGGPYLEKMEEPHFGNAPFITIEGKPVSQDTLNSLLEYLSMSLHYDISKVNTILEVGAGSGRTAYCFMRQLPHVKYIIVDIPPALYLSQAYLSQVFSDRKVFRFRHFDAYEEIKNEYEQADLVFMMPDQMRVIPDHSVDLFLAIDCLHEMKREVVQFYFNESQRLTSLFYFKCWMNTIVPFDNISYPFYAYPIPDTWQRIFEGPCVIPSDFAHAFYLTRSLAEKTSN